MEFLQVSKKHFSSLNELVRTQHRLLKLKIPMLGQPEAKGELTRLFADWSHINGNLYRLYQQLSAGTICLEDKQKQEQRMSDLTQKLQEIERTVGQMQFEKDSLEATCLKMKREMEDHDVRMSLQNAQLNKLSQEKNHLSLRLSETNTALKRQKKEQAESLRSCKDRLDSFKEKYEELQLRYRKLQELHRQTERTKDDELDRQLRQLEQLAEQQDY